MNAPYEAIHGFEMPSEYGRFCAYLARQIEAGVLTEIETDAAYGKGQIFGGRWLQVIETKQVWRLVPPDFPFRGLWEIVDRAV